MSTHPYTAYPTHRLHPEARNGFGITALVAALVGIIPGLMPITSFFAVMFGIVAVVFGLLGLGRVRRRTATNRGVTMAGTILGVLVIALGIWGMTLFFGTLTKLQTDLGGDTTTRTVSAPAAQVAPAPGTIPPGMYMVGGQDLAPGTYRTAGPPATAPIKYCYWARLSGTSGSMDQIITSGVSTSGAGIVTIKPGDAAFKTQGCQPWTRVK